MIEGDGWVTAYQSDPARVQYIGRWRATANHRDVIDVTDVKRYGGATLRLTVAGGTQEVGPSLLEEWYRKD